MGTFLVPYSLSVELVGTKHKTLVGCLIQIPFAIGESIVGLVAMAFQDGEWWLYQIAISAPLLGILVLYFIVPESPRWLIAKGRYKDAKNVIERAAKVNKVTIKHLQNRSKITLCRIFMPKLAKNALFHVHFWWEV